MGRCKDCKYWNNKIIGTYTKEFGFCENGKIEEYDAIKITYNPQTDKPIYDNFNNYHIIYNDAMETNKDFGCINFEEKEK